MAEATIIVYIGESRSFPKGLARRYQVLLARSGKQAVEHIENNMVAAVVLDAASMNTSGERICERLRTYLPSTPIIHVCLPESVPIRSSADVSLTMPFTIRKLTNSIERLLKVSAVNEGHILRCGPFVLNPEKRVLLTHDDEIALTPKQASLLELFFRRPNEVLERGWLMKQVWDTDYVGDTRTLDVHIRWLRCALENGAGKPHYLKTVRGRGYRLEIT